VSASLNNSGQTKRADDCTCEPQHRDPAGRPWGVRLSADRDADGRPAYLVVGPANGGHVSQRDVDWVWRQLNTDPETREPEQRPFTGRTGRGA
jgi:hypothetical protein